MREGGICPPLYARIANFGECQPVDNDQYRTGLLSLYRYAKGLYLNVKELLRQIPCHKCGARHDVEERCTPLDNYK